MKKDKEQKFKLLLVSGIDKAASNTDFTRLPSNAIAQELRRSFFSKGLGNIRFEFNTGQQSSRGFHRKRLETSNYLELDYVTPVKRDKLLTVIIPYWTSFIWRQMTWVILTSILLTTMIIAIFCYASISGGTGMQFHSQRTKAARNLMQQLEVPLTTVSVAADALRNARVMRDTGKIHYYQQVIDEENRHMNEQVERFLRELK